MFKIIGADQKEYGPISSEQIRQWIRDGRLNGQTPAQREGGADWQPLSSFAEFADLFQASAAPTPGAPAPGYAPSPTPSGGFPTATRDAALSAVKGPAIGIIVVASISIAYYLFSALMVLFGQGMRRPLPSNVPPEWQSFIEGSQGPLGAVLQLVFAAIAGFLLFGGIKMLKLQGHTLAIVTCIVAMLPCGCCCIFGLPFGIWGLVMLTKPYVKSEFTN